MQSVWRTNISSVWVQTGMCTFLPRFHSLALIRVPSARRPNSLSRFDAGSLTHMEASSNVFTATTLVTLLEPRSVIMRARPLACACTAEARPHTKHRV